MMKQAKTVIKDGKFGIKDGVLVEYCGNDEHLIIPEGIVSIESLAFSSCWKLEALFLPESVKSISSHAGLSYRKPTIYAPADSYAETYAKENNIPFVAE